MWRSDSGRRHAALLGLTRTSAYSWQHHPCRWMHTADRPGTDARILPMRLERPSLGIACDGVAGGEERSWFASM